MIIYRLEHKFSKKGPFSIKIKNYRDYILLFPEHIDYYRAYTCNQISLNISVVLGFFILIISTTTIGNKKGKKINLFDLLEIERKKINLFNLLM